MKTVGCPDCGADGIVECETCKGEGKIEIEEEQFEECSDCEAAGTLECETCAGEGSVRGSLWALLPPVIAIGLALITKEVYSSLLIGVVAGALMYSDFSFTGTLDSVINDGLISAVAGSAGIFIFLVELGIIVALVNKAGGSAAFGNWAKTHIKTRAGAMLATFVLGVLIFIDDYFNCLTVGSVMRPVTDSHRISRAKLAYLIDATAAPVCMIAPISSWAAAVSSYAEDGQGLALFIKAIPFNFYSLLTLVFIIAITLMNFDYCSMRIHEINAIENNDLYTCGEKNESVEVVPSSKGKVIDLVFPIIALIVSCVFALVYVGGIMDGANFIDAFANTDATVGLPWGGLVALVITMVYMLCRKVISFKESMDCVPQGFIAMVPAIMILTFATALKNMTSILGAKYFIGDLMSGQAGLANFLPAIIFLVACGLSFATGTSWGTFGILIPIVTSIFVDPTNPLYIIGISACLAGAVCGDHCSPISDTTIMSSAGGQCNHLNHVSTQLPYAITVAAISFVMYIFSGFVQNAWIALPIGIVLTVATLFVIKLIVKKKYAK
ncbi:MAG: Na+/H+ antiporter NhaC family protein [Clostridia bacterium]|nr:Na+/H+ antiporter NhaC family protein [Clostridia bacterium]MBQ8140566.1 Na+/H+ antiporter NhaC family protein [Clostridia bacterium]